MKKTQTTTIIAILTLVACFGMLFMVLLGFAKSNVSTTTQIVQLITQLIPIVLLFYFGASHLQTKNSLNTNKQTKLMTKQVFWDLTDVSTKIIAIDEEPINEINAEDIPNIDSRFSVGLDDQDNQVLMVNTTASVEITSSDNSKFLSVVSEFASGRPSRPK